MDGLTPLVDSWLYA